MKNASERNSRIQGSRFTRFSTNRKHKADRQGGAIKRKSRRCNWKQREAKTCLDDGSPFSRHRRLRSNTRTSDDCAIPRGKIFDKSASSEAQELDRNRHTRIISKGRENKTEEYLLWRWSYLPSLLELLRRRKRTNILTIPSSFNTLLRSINILLDE